MNELPSTWKVPTLVKKVPTAEVAEPPQLKSLPLVPLPAPPWAAVRAASEQNE